MALRPSDISGFNVFDRRTGTSAGLANKAFKTTCPPDVPPRSRIVAVCGATDFHNQADPSDDGWFFCDFYLFHHLLSPIGTHTMAQVWLTSEDPVKLVKKYKEYAHGDPRRERRVVLDASMLKSLQSAGNLRVVERDILLERFVTTLEEQAKLAADHREHLLILLFGHGEPDSCGVYIGGQGGSSEKDPKLMMEHVFRVVPKPLDATLFMTSCYSGGWLVQPNFHTGELLNVTGIAGCGATGQTRSWSLSRSVGRACGSSVASALVQSLIEIEEKGEAAREIREHPTYVGFAASVYDTLTRIQALTDKQGLSFSAQDDEWENHYKERTGLPLTRFKDRWESLRQIPPSGTESPSDPNAPTSARTAGRRRELQIRAKEYLSYRPGRDSLARNISLHGRLLRFFKSPQEFSDEDVEITRNMVTFRLMLFKHAEEYMEAMGITFPHCSEVDVDAWSGDRDPEMGERFSRATKNVFDARLFEKGCRYTDGWQPSKPWQYLAIALAETCSSIDGIKDKIAIACTVKEARDAILVESSPTALILNDADVRSKRQAFAAAMRELGRRVRIKVLSRTPSHRGYQAVATSEV